ncbi:MAG: response regulator [Anaeromyxobacter sp.]|nr:response regulator [Anaeromyxobacter sp.]MBL0277608.1 response regulator [Anaeromyxobacter sp.]
MRPVSTPLAGKRLLLIVEDAVLAALLAEAASRLGAEATVAPTGRAALEALARPPLPGAAVLDLPLPDVRGSEVLAALRRAGVPVVAISGAFRGPQAAGEVLRAGAADFFEKPFPVLALMARVARLMGEALPGLGEPEDEVTGAIPLGPGPGGGLDDAPFLALTDDDQVHEPPPATGADALASPLPAPPRQPAPAGSALAPPGPPPRRGDLGQASVPRLLVALHVAQATGALTVRRGPVKKILLLEKGAPIYAASNVAGERLGAICVRRGVIAADALLALRRADPAARTADLLLAARALTPARRAELTSAQVRAIAWSTFEWRDGEYDFQLARPPAGLLQLGLSMADLLLEGLVRASTLPTLLAELPRDLHLAPSPAPAFELYALGLRPAEAHLLSLCDGTKSVQDLAALARVPEREALAFLQALRVMRVLESVESVLAGTRRIGFM